MKKMITNRTITISEFDYLRLQELLVVANQFSDPTPSYLGDLERELQRAKVVPPEQIPPHVISMNTQFKLTDTDTGIDSIYTLVFPGDADVEEGKLSILSELGVAVLGYSVGDTVDWQFSDGSKSFRINMIGFQPEATKQFEL